MIEPCKPTGQAAWMIKNPEGYATSFFASIPWGNAFFYLNFVTTILAACVASQAMMSAAFSIVKQSMSLNCFPRVLVIHTSRKVLGQLWIPVVMVRLFFVPLALSRSGRCSLGFACCACLSVYAHAADAQGFFKEVHVVCIAKMYICLELAFLTNMNTLMRRRAVL